MAIEFHPTLCRDTNNPPKIKKPGRVMIWTPPHPHHGVIMHPAN
jgi:hypothetical protein